MIVKEKGIPLYQHEVQGILDNRQSQLRRVIKPQLIPIIKQSNLVNGKVCLEMLEGDIPCPYGQVGDKLWAKETFCYKVDQTTAQLSHNEFWYRATNPEIIKADGDGGFALTKNGCEASPWKPSIHMPRWASRINLEITEIRVEKVQNISIDDCISEGIIYNPLRDLSVEDVVYKFSELWNSIHDKGWPIRKWDESIDHPYRWHLNPWVWCISFRRIN